MTDPRRLVIAWLAGVVLLAGCSQVPNLDAGSAGCSNARGIGPASGDASAILAQLEGLSAAEAWNKMTAQGHTVVFDTGQCWCVPPPSGKVAFAFFNQHGALGLMLDDVDPALTTGDPPFLGWGC